MDNLSFLDNALPKPKAPKSDLSFLDSALPANGLSFLDSALPKSADPLKVNSVLDKMRGSIMTQESGGNQNARNQRTSATGLFQVMPANIPVWTKKYYKRPLSQQEFANDREAQEAVFNGEMGKYVQKALQLSGGDEDKAIRMASAAWYGGEGNMKNYDANFGGKGNEPTFRQYTTSVLNRIKKNGGMPSLAPQPNPLVEQGIIEPTVYTPAPEQELKPIDPRAWDNLPNPFDAPQEQSQQVLPPDTAPDDELQKAWQTVQGIDAVAQASEAIKGGGSLKEYDTRQAEIQARFDAEKAKDPTLTTERFNQQLTAENEAKNAQAKTNWLKSNPDLEKFATEKKLDPFANETIDAFNRTQRGKSVARTALPTVQPPVSLQAQPQSIEPVEAQDDSVREINDNFTERVEFRDKPDGVSNKEWFIQQLIPRIASRTGYDEASVEKELRKADFETLGQGLEKGTPLSKIAKDKWFEFVMSPEMSDRIATTAGRQYATKQATIKADADFEERKKSIDPNLSEADRDLEAFRLRGLADMDAGLLDPAKQVEAYEKAKKDVEAWKEDRGFLGIWNQEEWADVQRFLGGRPDTSNRPASESYQPSGLGESVKSPKDYFNKAYEDMRKQYGSVSNWAIAQKEFKERFKDKPFTYLMKTGEAGVGGVMKAPFKGASSVLKSIAIGAEAIERGLGIENPEAEKKYSYTLAKSIEDLAEGIKIDKDFKGGNAELAGDIFGQVIIQTGLGIATGGASAPAAFGAMQGLSEGYEAGTKEGLDGWTRLGKSLAAGLIEAPDYFIFKGMLKGGKLVNNISVVQNLKDSVQKGLIARGLKAPVAEKIAVAATDGFLAELIAKGGWKGTVGKVIEAGAKKAKIGGAEALQEGTTQPFNDLYAYMAYDPSPERWAKATTPTKEMFVEGVAGFFGGIVGASLADINARTQMLDVEGVKQAEALVDEQKDVLPTETYNNVKTALQNRKAYFAKDAEINAQTKTEVQPQSAPKNETLVESNQPVEVQAETKVEPEKVVEETVTEPVVEKPSAFKQGKPKEVIAEGETEYSGVDDFFAEESPVDTPVENVADPKAELKAQKAERAALVKLGYTVPVQKTLSAEQKADIVANGVRYEKPSATKMSVPPKSKGKFEAVEVSEYTELDQNKFKPNEQLKFNQGAYYEPVRLIADPDLIELITAGARFRKGDRTLNANARVKQLEQELGISMLDAHTLAKDIAKANRDTNVEMFVHLGNNVAPKAKAKEPKPDKPTPAVEAPTKPRPPIKLQGIQLSAKVPKAKIEQVAEAQETGFVPSDKQVKAGERLVGLWDELSKALDAQTANETPETELMANLAKNRFERALRNASVGEQVAFENIRKERGRAADGVKSSSNQVLNDLQEKYRISSIDLEQGRELHYIFRSGNSGKAKTIDVKEIRELIELLESGAELPLKYHSLMHIGQSGIYHTKGGKHFATILRAADELFRVNNKEEADPAATEAAHEAPTITKGTTVYSKGGVKGTVEVVDGKTLGVDWENGDGTLAETSVDAVSTEKPKGKATDTQQPKADNTATISEGDVITNGDKTGIYKEIEHNGKIHKRVWFSDSGSPLGNSIEYKEGNWSKGQASTRAVSDLDASAPSFANARKLPTKTLATNTNFAKNTRIVDNGVIAVDEIAEIELIRRLLGGNTQFYGVMAEPSHIADFNKKLDKMIAFTKVGKVKANLRKLKGLVNDAIKDGTVIFAMSEESLPEEKAHRALFGIRGKDTHRAHQIAPAVLKSIVDSPVFKNAKKFQRDYNPSGVELTEAKKALLAEEFAVKASLGQWNDLGITSKADKREAKGLAIDFYESFAETNKGELTSEQIIEKLATEIAYAKDYLESQEIRRNEKEAQNADKDSAVESTKREKDRPDAESRQADDGKRVRTSTESSKEREAEQEPTESKDDADADGSRGQEKGKKESDGVAPDILPYSFQETLANTGRGDFGLEGYVPETMDSWTEEASNIIQSQGTDKAILEYHKGELKQSVKNALGLQLIDILGNQGNINAMNEIAFDMIEKSLDMGRAIKALDLANKYDPQSWRYFAAKQKSKSKKGAELTIEEELQGRALVEKYTSDEDALTITTNALKGNREVAKQKDEAIKAIDEAIAYEKDLELTELKAEIATLKKQLAETPSHQQKGTKKAKDLRADIEKRQAANNAIIKAFLKADERGSFIVTPAQKYQIDGIDVGLDQPVFEAFRDIATIKLLEELPKGEMSLADFRKYLTGLSKGKLSSIQSDQIMAAAVNEIRQTKEHTLTPEQLVKQQKRREFYKTAYEILGEPARIAQQKQREAEKAEKRRQAEVERAYEAYQSEVKKQEDILFKARKKAQDNIDKANQKALEAEYAQAQRETSEAIRQAEKAFKDQQRAYAKQVAIDAKEAIKQGIASPRDIFHTQLVTTSRNIGAEENVVIGTNVLKTTKNLTKWRNTMRALFPNISRQDLDNIFRKATDLKRAVDADLHRARANEKAGRTLTDEEYARLKRQEKTDVGSRQRSRGELDSYYRHLTVSRGKQIGRAIRQTTNIGRSLQASLDASYAGRQGMALNALESRESAKGLWAGTANAVFEEDFDYFLYQMENDPVAQEMKDYGWSSRAVLKNPLDFEEFYLSQVPMKMAELGDNPNTKIGQLLNTSIGKKAIYAPKKLGQAFKTSERLFELQGDMQGYYVYNKWRKELDAMAKADPNFDVDRAKTHLIRIINAGTGRGNFNVVFGEGGRLQQFLTEVFYSPRFMLSRPEFVLYTNPVGLALAPAGARRAAARSSVKMYGKVAALFLPLAMLGLTSLDPEDDEFLMIRYGDDKKDVTGKLNEPLRALAMMVKLGVYAGMSESSDPGIRGAGKAGMERIGAYYTNVEEWGRYFRGKLSPQASLIADYGFGSDFLGRPFTWTNAIASRTIPLSGQSMWGALTYDRRDAVMMEPITFDTFASNVQKVATGKKNDNLLRMLYMTVPDVGGIGGSTYPKDLSTTALVEARRLMNANYAEKTDDEKAEQKIDGVDKWRIKNGIVRLGRLGYDVNVVAEQYKGRLTADDIKQIKAKVAKLPIEVTMKSATTDQTIQVLRFTTPYQWFVQPFVPRNDKNRAIERERLLKLLKIKADNASKDNSLTKEELKRVKEELPNYARPDK